MAFHSGFLQIQHPISELKGLIKSSYAVSFVGAIRKVMTVGEYVAQHGAAKTAG